MCLVWFVVWDSWDRDVRLYKTCRLWLYSNISGEFLSIFHLLILIGVMESNGVRVWFLLVLLFHCCGSIQFSSNHNTITLRLPTPHNVLLFLNVMLFDMFLWGFYVSAVEWTGWLVERKVYEKVFFCGNFNFLWEESV